MDGRTFILTGLVGLCTTSPAVGQVAPAQIPTIRVTGNATLHAQANRAEVDIGVVTQDPQAERAASENSGRVEAVLAALREVGGAKTDIKTVGYALTPDYRYQSGGAQPEIIGYTATNTVQVTLDDLKETGALIDSAARSGANRVADIRFTLRDPEEIRTQALREAAKEARDEADALAAALGLKISRVLSVTEGVGYARPIRPIRFAMTRAASAAAPTPIQAGNLDVNASVTLTVELADQHHPAG